MSRVKPKEFWDKHVEAFLKSGMSQRAYCRLKRLKHRALSYHLCKNQRTKSIQPRSPEKRGIDPGTTWLPITIVDEPSHKSSGRIRLQISRITIDTDQGCDGALLAHVLRAVGAAC